MESDDPTVIRSLAVTADDVVAALEANRRQSGETVLRVTPPFSGRMRARLHRTGAEADEGSPEPLHVPPERFVASIPPLPTPDETEDELRDAADVDYDPETHRRRHEAALEEWRAAIRDAFVDDATIETSAGPHEVEVSVLE